MASSGIWQKTGQGRYSFSNQYMEKAHIETISGLWKIQTSIVCGQRNLSIKKTGLLNNNLEIFDDGQLVARLSPVSWFSSSYILEYGNKNYTISIRNNPLVEWYIADDVKREILSYRLQAEKGEMKVCIRRLNEDKDSFLDSLLYYLMLPVLEENMDDVIV